MLTEGARTASAGTGPTSARMHEASAIHAFLRQVCDTLHRSLKLRIQVGNFEALCRMVEASVGVGVLPESAASRHAQSMAIRIVPLSGGWSLRAMHICVRKLDALPPFARDLVDLLVADAAAARAGGAPPGWATSAEARPRGQSA